MTPWLFAHDFAHLALMTRQRARKLLNEFANERDLPWRGATLLVRTIHGRGGKSGKVYQVRLDSLPIALQNRAKEAYRDGLGVAAEGARGRSDWDFWHHVIAPALAHPKGSRARDEAIAAAAEIERFLPGRPPFRVSARTIQRKLDAFEATGDLASLSRRRRADAGQKAVIVSRRWDHAVALDDADKQRIAKALRYYVRGLHVKGEGAALMAEMASTKLAALTRAAGVELGATALTVCRVPSHLIDAERVYRRVHLLKSDRKAYEDQKPRILRKLADEPMEVVYGDVHPVDIVLLRDDGSQVHARAIGWLDDATRRIWIDLVLLEKGEGVTNAHVIRSFIAMASAWGLPKTLYLDNGAEYNFADFITDAMRLRDAAGHRLIGAVSGSPVVRAKPYNASAKAIEGIFKVLENTYFKAIPGWIGGDYGATIRERTARQSG